MRVREHLAGEEVDDAPLVVLAGVDERGAAEVEDPLGGLDVRLRVRAVRQPASP